MFCLLRLQFLKGCRFNFSHNFEPVDALMPAYGTYVPLDYEPVQCRIIEEDHNVKLSDSHNAFNALS